MTPREILGWTPTEVQRHYNPNGELVGVTEIDREPRISAEERFELLALAQYEAGVGPCGFHSSLSYDGENVFSPVVTVCPVCAAIDKQGRILAERDKKAVPDKAPATHSRPSDGRSVHMRLLSEAEVEELRASKRINKPD